MKAYSLGLIVLALVVLGACSKENRRVSDEANDIGPIEISSSTNLVIPPDCEPPLLRSADTGALLLAEDASAPLISYSSEK